MDKSRAGLEQRSESSGSSQKGVEFNYPKPILEQEIVRVQESASEEFRAAERTSWRRGRKPGTVPRGAMSSAIAYTNLSARQR